MYLWKTKSEIPIHPCFAGDIHIRSPFFDDRDAGRNFLVVKVGSNRLQQRHSTCDGFFQLAGEMVFNVHPNDMTTDW